MATSSDDSPAGTIEQGASWVSNDPNVCQTRVIARGYSSEVYEVLPQLIHVNTMQMRDNRTSQVNRLATVFMVI